MGYIEEGKSNIEFACSDERNNIFLIGDSIREGYCNVVKNELSNIANVFYINDNNRNTQFVITRLREYCNKFDYPDKVNVIHFNCGHWDIAHWDGSENSLTSITEYARNLETIISLLKKLFVNAKLIFATTSPMNPCGAMSPNPRTNEEIDKYNSAAIGICKRNNIFINDINKFMREWDSECYKDYAHLTDESYLKLGKEIAKIISDVLTLN